MPRDHTRAYQSFEQSLGDSFLSTPRQDQHWRKSKVLDSAFATPQGSNRQVSAPAQKFAQEGKGSTTSPPTDSKLPPTPASLPRPIRSIQAHTTVSPRQSHISQASNPNTLIDLMTLNTPDTTPLPSEDRNVSGMNTSYTDSFITALEEQSPSHWTRSPVLSNQVSRSTLTPTPKDSALPQEKQIERSKTGVSNWRQTLPLLRSKPDVENFEEVLTSASDNSESQSLPNLEHSKHSLRRCRPSMEEYETGHEPVPILMRGLSVRNGQSGRSRSSQRSCLREVNPRTIRDDSFISKSREISSTRASDISGLSNVVEAIVIDTTPPQRKRKLRHVSKNVDLREDASLGESNTRYSADSNHQSRVASEESSVSPVVESSPSIGSHSLRRVGNMAAVGGSQTLSAPPIPMAANDLVCEGEAGHPSPPLTEVDAFNNFPCKNSDQSSVGTAYGSRPSGDNVRSHNRGFLTPRQLRALESSPLSFFSEALSIYEATAVSIFPHHNESLLLVQHGPVTNPLLHHPVRQGRRAEPTPEVHSDTTNTQHCLDAPTFALIPPTPADEMGLDDTSLVYASQQSKAAALPSRQLSLLNRARKYSDIIIQPIVTFTTISTSSLRRNLTLGGYINGTKRPRISSPKLATMANQTLDSKLHPFWQPRGIWDDLSDQSEDESRAAEEEGIRRGIIKVDENGRHIPVFDTVPSSDTAGNSMTEAGFPAAPQSSFVKWRLNASGGGSLRGFLVGNTLGLERGSTNKRRHIVRWPSDKAMRTPGTGHATDFRVDGAEMTQGKDERGRVATKKSFTKSRKSRKGVGTFVQGWKRRALTRR